MKNLIQYILLGIIIIFIMWLFFVLMSMPIWVVVLLIIAIRYKDIKEFINKQTNGIKH